MSILMMTRREPKQQRDANNSERQQYGRGGETINDKNYFALEQGSSRGTETVAINQQPKHDTDIYQSSEGDYDELGKQRRKVNKTDNEDEYHHAYFGEQTEDNVYNVANSNGRSHDDASGYGELGNDYHVNDSGYGKFQIQAENAENHYDHC